MISISLATVFLKQHSAFDGLGSLVMAYVMYHFVYSESFVPSRETVSEKAISKTNIPWRLSLIGQGIFVFTASDGSS